MRISLTTIVQLMIAAYFHRHVKAQFNFCTPLANNTWEAMVEAIADSYKIAVLCPFRISGDGCPSSHEYPEGLVIGREDPGVMIIECDIQSLSPDDDDTNTKCILDCPGRHFTVAPFSGGLTLTNMILSGATNTSIIVEQGGRLDVANTQFENNSAADSDGGAIELHEGSIVSVEFSIFRSNNGIVGGAIYAKESSRISLRHSLFAENKAVARGGAIAFDSNSIVNISASAFQGNEAFHGGAIYLAGFGELSAFRSTFEGNIATAYGGAVFTEGFLMMTESSFLGNIGVEGGGAINCGSGASTTLIGNAFIDNRSQGRGPAVYDRYNSGVANEGNVGCQNRVHTDELLGVNPNLHCNGVYWLAPLRLRRCQPFQTQCVDSTNAPSIPASLMPSFQPSTIPMYEVGRDSVVPSGRPTTNTVTTAPPSTVPSAEYASTPSNDIESMTSSPSPTIAERSDRPSSSPTLEPTKSSASSQIPSDAPSLIPSDTPSLAPSY